MKTTELLTIVVAMVIVVSLVPTIAFANHGCGNVRIGIGIGFPIYPGYGYWAPYYYYPYYPVVYAPPPYYPVVVSGPVVIDQPIIVTRAIPQPSYNSDLSTVRIRKVQLLDQLKQGAESERLQAISELAGYSFDDQVRAALENLLLSDPSAAIREEVTVSFGKVKNHAALAVLKRVRVEDPDRDVREAADKAISQIKS